ncbi:SdrD B-like domain-containing protein [Runella sp. MFBS21]|uniref:SdrD B-like domain-containing protein n=1 Tax=Runella sp. MFBS21 TaxID=3034018 RepID=UPI0023F82494|nr:SdrD B-like domain-containing protein [Runella sp. MFBS21]MDF7819382.1 SdrD B-like domain-containing protein [Runella sp. MFBS21]
MKHYILLYYLKPTYCMLLFWLLAIGAQSQVVLTLDYQAAAGTPTSVPSGQYWTMKLNYSVSSTTGSASGVKITIPMPDYVDDELSGISGTTHAPAGNFVFTTTPGAKKLTINFIDPVPSGSTGVLEFQMRSRNGYTPDGTVIHTCATLTDGAGNTSGDKCHDMGITATLGVCGLKKMKYASTPAVGTPITYQILLSGPDINYPQNVNTGGLNLTNISITDTYPAGATFVSAKVVDGTGNTVSSTINQSGNTVTATFPDMVYATAYTLYFQIPLYILEVTVKYDSPGFSSGQSVTNAATVTLTPLGKSPVTFVDGSTASGCTSDLIETHTLTTPTANATIRKWIDGNNDPIPATSGSDIGYYISFQNTGSVPLENTEIIETVPADFTLHRISFGNASSDIIGLQYQTNLNASWTNFTISDPYNIGSPSLGSGEKITKVKFLLATPFEAGRVLANGCFIVFTGNSVSASTPVTNCIEWNSTTSNLPSNRESCNSQIVLNPTPTTSSVAYSANHSPGCTTWTLGQTLTLSGNVEIKSGYANIQDPTVAFLVPPGFQYIPGSETFDPSSSQITTTPTLTITPNFVVISGVTYALYRWTFPSGTIGTAPGFFKVTVNVKITSGVPAGVLQNILFLADGSNTSVKAGDTYGYTYTDTNDWDGDGNTTEQAKAAHTSNYGCDLKIQASTSMESIKWVKGLLDSEYSRYPNSGLTVPGGNADYKLIVKNTGNVTMKDIKIIDILPFIGDRGVIDPQARNTEWRPNLADPISAPAGITVYYSTVGNPCRDEVKQPADPSPFPAGCAAPNWSTTPPSDITKVQSVKIDFGATQLAGGDSLVFNWPMRAPVNAPTNGEIAWNSFAFVATRSDNDEALIAAEPIKVGIKVQAGAPAYYGDRVWFDTNKNGVQDAGEGGVDGIKVKLFTPRVVGTQNPATDSLVNFTITGNGGLYKFSNLKPGDYYAVFCLPTGYSISPKDATNDAEDSDGTQTTYNGELATIVPITNLTANEEDLTWDQGIFCEFTPAVTPIQTVAANSFVTLTASGGTTYLWSGPNGFTASTASITINPVTPADTGSYVVNIEVGACRASLTTGIKIGSACTKPLAAVTPKTQTICVGGAVTAYTATPSSEVAYKWYGPLADTTSSLGTAISGATNASYTPTGTALTTAGTKYYAVVVNTTGDAACADTAFVRLVVNAKPSIADGSASICVGESVDLTSKITGYANYQSPVWTVSTVGGTAVATPTSVKPTSTTTYVLVAQNAAGCKDTAQVVVTVNQKPSAGTDQTLTCANPSTNELTTSTTLTGTPTSGNWAAQAGNPASATVTNAGAVTGMSVAGTYKFIYTSAAGCSDTVAVTVQACQGCTKPDAGSDAASVCQPTSTAKLTALTAGGTWAAQVGNPSAASIDANGNITGLSAAGTYKFIYSVTSGGQTCTDTAQVVVNAKPSIADGSASICVGESVDLTSKITGYASYQSPVWTLSTAGGTAVATPASVHLTTMTTYVLVAQNAAGCKDTAQVVVTVNQKPSAGTDQTLTCANPSTNELTTSTTLTGTPTSGNWAAQAGNPASATVTNAGAVTGMSIAGTYKFIYTSAAGCSDTVAVTVQACTGCVKPNAGADAASVCQPTKTAKLTAVTSGGTWSPIGSPSNPSSATIEASGNINGLNTAGTYRFVYSVTSGGQTCTDTAQVVVKAKPNAGKDTTFVCVNGNVPSSVQLSATPNGGSWSALTDNPTGATVNSSGLVNITNSTAQGKSFNFVYSVNGCQDTVKVIVPVCSSPCIESTITVNDPVCSPDVQTYSFTFTVSNKLGVVKVNKGTLSGNNPYTVSGIPSGQSVLIVDSLSAVCKVDTTVAGVNCNCNPALPQLLTPSTTVCIGDTFPTLKATVVGLATVEWFSQSSGGSVIFTGLNFKPSGLVSKDTVFYAQARSTDPSCPAAISTTRVGAFIEAQNCEVNVDLALKKSINKKIAKLGDTLTYTIQVFNQSSTGATGVEVVDSIATTVGFIPGSFVASRGSATITNNVIKWTIGNIGAPGDTVRLIYKVKAISEGIHFNTAEISKVNEKDVDSTPGNGKESEDDIDGACFSVPLQLCVGQKLEVTVPSRYTNVVWYKEGSATAIAMGNVVLLGEVGTYTFSASNQTCPAGGCCPVIIEEGTNCCPVDICIPFTIQKQKKK